METQGRDSIGDSGASAILTGDRSIFRGFVRACKMPVSGISGANAIFATGIGHGVLITPWHHSGCGTARLLRGRAEADADQHLCASTGRPLNHFHQRVTFKPNLSHDHSQ